MAPPVRGTGAGVVYVASQNPAKISAVTSAVRLALPNRFQAVVGMSAPSGVPDQPVGDEQTLAGATNRVLYAAERAPTEALVIAIEGGVAWRAPLPAGRAADAAARAGDARAPASQPLGPEAELVCFAHVAVRGPHSALLSRARSAEFLLPSALAQLVGAGLVATLAGMELGDADDQLFGRVRSGQGSGTIGKLTGDIITRAALYEQAVLLALVPYMCEAGLYPGYDPMRQ